MRVGKLLQYCMGFFVGCAIAAPLAKADYIAYSQPLGGGTSWTSTYDPSAYGSIYTTYDNFSLAATGAIDKLTWYGFGFDASTLKSAGNPVTSFNISFYANNAGVPGTEVYSSNVSFTESLYGNFDLFGNGGSEPFYSYAASLATPFVADQGIEYWVSIQGVTAYPTYWSWYSGTGGDGSSYQTFNYGASPGVQNQDRAFTLFAAPAPSAFAGGLLLVPGVVLMRLWQKSKA
jgi:hypothetical protein